MDVSRCSVLGAARCSVLSAGAGAGLLVAGCQLHEHRAFSTIIRHSAQSTRKVTSDLHIVILAAGKGTRMKSARPKVLHRVAGLPMIDYVLAAAASLHPRTVTVVVGHQAETLQAALAHRTSLTFVGPGATTRHRTRPPVCIRGAERGVRDARPVVRRRAPPDGQHIENAGRLPHVPPAAATVVTAMVDQPEGTADRQARRANCTYC